MDIGYLVFVLVSIGALTAAGWLLWTLWQGPPYVPSKDAAIAEMLDLLKLKRGERVAELGAGDGRLAIALAKAGAKVDGFEINPVLARIARQNVRRAGLTDRVTIRRASFWRTNLAPYRAVTVFGMPHVMEKLGRKLQRECRPGTRIVSNAFPIPGLKRTGRSTRALRYRVE